MDSSGIMEEQRKLEEDSLLEPGSDESVADEAEAPNMEISDDEEDGGCSHVKPEMVAVGKVLSAGVGTNSSLEGGHSDACNTAGGEVKSVKEGGTLCGSSSSPKPYGVGTPVLASASLTGPKPSGVGASNGATSTVGVGTIATTASSLPSSKPLGVDAPAASTPAPEGTQDGTYLAINMYRRQAGTALNLLGGAQCRSSTTGSIFNGNPYRHKLCHSRWDFAKKLNIMASWDTAELECCCCSEHTKVLEKRVLTRPVYRRTIVLTDQNFIATAPSTAEDKQCMKIIRVENASLWDLHNLFRDLIWDRDLAVPVGSCILIGSASHLGNVGSAVYAEELVQINMRLAQMFDGTIFFVPCPPMMVDGSSDPALIRGIFEIAAWLRNVMGADSCFLPNSYRVMEDLLHKRGTGTTTATNVRMMLPAGLASINRTRWDSGSTNLPAGVLPLSSEDEAALITTLIGELNANLKMDLDPSPDFSPCSRRKKKGPLILMVGASHAGRTAHALEDEGATVLRAIIPGWRVMKSKIQSMVDLMKEKLGEVKGDCTVIYQLFDNSFHMAKTEEGGLIPAVRESGPGGKFHVQGEAVFAPKELQYAIFNQVKPLLEVAEPYQRVMISPLPRYLESRCCDQSEHVSNILDEDYREVQEEAILACRRNLKDFAFRLGLKTRVICPWSQLRNLDDLWPTDPVHMDSKGYIAIAGQILVALQQSSSMDRELSKKGGGRDGSTGRSGGGGNSRQGTTPAVGGWRPQRGRGRGGGTWR